MANESPEIGDCAHIYEGSALRVRWMRYRGAFPARDFLEGFPDDFAQFLHRANEMARTGTIFLKKHGHPVHGRKYAGLFQFNMDMTRSWGFRIERVFVVALAAKKQKGQESDYDKALDLRDNYLSGNHEEDC